MTITSKTLIIVILMALAAVAQFATAQTQAPVVLWNREVIANPTYSSAGEFSSNGVGFCGAAAHCV
jgi:hypothetical protein